METMTMGHYTDHMTTPRQCLHIHLRITTWLLQLVMVGILGQTLYFKFTAAPESVYIFQTLGMEPHGRIASGVAEGIACVLLLIPRTAIYGAALSLAVITGALGSHLTKLGIVVQNDGGLLFTLACIVFACAVGVLLIRRAEIPIVGVWLAARSACPHRRAVANAMRPR